MIIDFLKRKKQEPFRFDEKKLEQERPVSTLYFKQMESIDVQWAVISNLRAYNSKEAQNLELLCIQNTLLYKSIVNEFRAKGIEEPHHAPCYVRLCMLYEKQGRFEDAVQMCKEAIDAGAYDDGSKGKMYGRLARLLRKAAAQIPDEEVIEQKAKK